MLMLADELLATVVIHFQHFNPLSHLDAGGLFIRTTPDIPLVVTGVAFISSWEGIIHEAAHYSVQWLAGWLASCIAS